VRIILDTAILVRGHGSSQGLARDLLIGIVESDHILLLSNEMLYELARVLRYPRMLALHGLSEKRIYDYVGFLREAAEIVVPNPLRLCGGLVCAISSRPRFLDHEMPASACCEPGPPQLCASDMQYCV
jgi:predicted nucleic acid-binding protein